MTCESERRRLNSLRKRAGIDQLEVGDVIFWLDVTCPNTEAGEDTYGHASRIGEDKEKRERFYRSIEKKREEVFQRAREILSDDAR